MEKIENLVLSREQMLYLQELGLDTSDAALSWIRFVRKSGKKKKSKWKVRTTTAERLNCRNFPDMGHYQGVPTYTLEELLGKLPECISFGGFSDKAEFSYHDGCVGYYVYYRTVKTEIYEVDVDLHSVYELLCWTLENEFKEEK